MSVYNHHLVLRITTAYEQGVGHARRTELSNPYGKGTPEYEAWDMGREFGKTKPTVYERVPACNTEVADFYMEKSLENRDWPCNPKNACRAGWEAARNFIRANEIT